MNLCVFTGHIGKDAEVRHTAAGKVVASFSLANQVGYGDKAKTLWIRCNLWGDRGEKLAQYLLKGKKITVSGEITTSEYEANGEKRFSLELFVRDLELPPRGESVPANSTDPAPADGFNPDTDIPFNNPYKRREYAV
jgi:single-strand DNA-binding protein